MSNAGQDLDEIQLLARIFLAIFVLIGFIPFFQKSFSRLHDFILSLRRPRTPGIAASMTELEGVSAESSRLSDIEYIVFTRLAQIEARGVRLTTLTQNLHLEELLITKAMQSLQRRGLVRIIPGWVIGRRFSLSGEGRALAIAEGLTPRLSRPTNLSGSEGPDARGMADHHGHTG